EPRHAAGSENHRSAQRRHFRRSPRVQHRRLQTLHRSHVFDEVSFSGSICTRNGASFWCCRFWTSVAEMPCLYTRQVWPQGRDTRCGKDEVTAFSPSVELQWTPLLHRKL